MSEKQIKGEGNASFADEGEDLYNPAYTGALVESAQAIVEQNRHLLLRSQERNFNPVTELDFTSNGAGWRFSISLRRWRRFVKGASLG